MSFCIGIIIGTILGAVTMAIMTAGRDCATAEEFYYKGFEDGKHSVNT